MHKGAMMACFFVTRQTTCQAFINFLPIQFINYLVDDGSVLEIYFSPLVLTPMLNFSPGMAKTDMTLLEMTRSFTRTENLVFCGESPEEKAGTAKKENKKKRPAGKKHTLL